MEAGLPLAQHWRGTSARAARPWACLALLADGSGSGQAILVTELAGTGWDPPQPASGVPWDAMHLRFSRATGASPGYWASVGRRGSETTGARPENPVGRRGSVSTGALPGQVLRCESTAKPQWKKQEGEWVGI